MDRELSNGSMKYLSESVEELSDTSESFSSFEHEEPDLDRHQMIDI